jgi:hypothetical protein
MCVYIYVEGIQLVKGKKVTLNMLEIKSCFVCKWNRYGMNERIAEYKFYVKITWQKNVSRMNLFQFRIITAAAHTHEGRAVAWQRFVSTGAS